MPSTLDLNGRCHRRHPSVPTSFFNYWRALRLAAVIVAVPFCPGDPARDSYGRFGGVFRRSGQNSWGRTVPSSRCMIAISRYIQYRSSDPTCWQGRLSLKHYESPLERPNEQLSNLGPRCQHYTNVSLIAVGHHLSRTLRQELVERISVPEDSELTRRTLVVLW